MTNPDMKLKTIKPNKEGDWINQRNDSFKSFLPIGEKDNKKGQVIFELFSSGVMTNRDAWVCNFSRDITRTLKDSIGFFVTVVYSLKERHLMKLRLKKSLIRIQVVLMG